MLCYAVLTDEWRTFYSLSISWNLRLNYKWFDVIYRRRHELCSSSWDSAMFWHHTDAVPQACDTVVDPRIGELARSCCSNTSPILPHPRLQGVWCPLPETSYLVYSKYFLSFLCGQHQSQPSCISSRANVSSLHTFHGCYSLWFNSLLSACGLLLG